MGACEAVVLQEKPVVWNWSLIRMVTGWGDWMAIFNQVHWSAPLGILNIMRTHGIKEGHRPGSLPVGWMTCVCNTPSFWSDLGYFGMTLPNLLFWSKDERNANHPTPKAHRLWSLGMLFGLFSGPLHHDFEMYEIRESWQDRACQGNEVHPCVR